MSFEEKSQNLQKNNEQLTAGASKKEYPDGGVKDDVKGEKVAAK